MVKKTIRIGLHEMKMVDIACKNCGANIRYQLERGFFKVHKCPVCDDEHKEEYQRALMKLQEVFKDIPNDKKELISFEIDIKDN